MKKKFAAILLILVFAMQVISPCLAGNDDIKVKLDGKQIEFDVPPMIMADRTMVPVRAIFEALGYDVQWDAEKRAIKAVSEVNEINMYIDFYTFWSNGISMQTDVAPCIVDGRTLVPVRVISEASGCAVEWNADERTVYISADGQNLPSASPTPEPTLAPGETATPTPAPTENAIILDKTTLSLKEGETFEFNPAVKAWYADKKIVWESSDYTVASVTSYGKVAGEEAGTCTITARIGKEYATCEVTVKNVAERPELDITSFDTTKLFVDNREYITMTLRNYSEMPVTLEGTATYSYLTGAELTNGSLTKEALYDIYTVNLEADVTVIPAKSYKLIKFTRTKDKPKVGKQTTKDKFDEYLSFKFTYDGKTYTGKKYKSLEDTTENKGSEDFKY